MYFLCRLQGSDMDNTLMKMFYSCFTESVLTHSFISWFGTLSLKSKNRIQGASLHKDYRAILNDISDLYTVRAQKTWQTQLIPCLGNFCCFFLLVEDTLCQDPKLTDLRTLLSLLQFPF